MSDDMQTVGDWLAECPDAKVVTIVFDPEAEPSIQVFYPGVSDPDAYWMLCHAQQVVFGY